MKKRDICFYVFWIILLIGKGFGWDSSWYQFRYMTICAIPFAAIKLIYSKWTKKELITCILMNVVGLAVMYYTRSTDILLATITITACKDIDLYKLFKISFWIKAIMFVMTTEGAIAGRIYDQPSYRWHGGDEFELRYALGYGQPNATHFTLFIIIILGLLSYHHKMKLYHYLVFFAYNMYILQYTTSRTGMLMCTLALVLVFLMDRRKEIIIRNVIKYLGKYTYIIAAIISVVLTVLYGRVYFLYNLGTLSARFDTASRIMNAQRIPLFGIPNIDTDFGLMEILYGKGVIVFMFYVIVMTLVIRKHIKQKRYVEASICIMYAIYSLSESYNSSVLMNISLLFITEIIYSNNRSVGGIKSIEMIQEANVT